MKAAEASAKNDPATKAAWARMPNSANMPKASSRATAITAPLTKDSDASRAEKAVWVKSCTDWLALPPSNANVTLAMGLMRKVAATPDWAIALSSVSWPLDSTTPSGRSPKGFRCNTPEAAKRWSSTTSTSLRSVGDELRMLKIVQL